MARRIDAAPPSTDRITTAGARLPVLTAALLATVGFLALSWNDAHYWDEFFYLYSVLVHSPTELVRYELHSDILPVGFFSEKLGHVVLLSLLTGLLGAGERVVYAIQALYALLMLGVAGAAYGLIRELTGEREARATALVLLFTPLALYLSFKVMSEVPSLLLTTLGSWAFVRSFRRESPRVTASWLLLATVALAAAMLCRIPSVASFGGLGLALLVAGGERFERRRLLVRLLAVGVAAAGVHMAGLALVGGSVLRLGEHVQSMVATHPAAQRVYALALFLQTLVLVLPFAWWRNSDAKPWTASLWLVASAAPFLAGHEPRYYAPALVPLALLAADGFRRAADVLFGARFRYAWVALLSTSALVSRAFLIPLMPYEVEQSRLLKLYHLLHARSPNATYFIPWISDYSLLRFAFPNDSIMLCLSNLPVSRHFVPGHGSAIAGPDQWWVGADHYVGSRSALLERSQPWYYVGWSYNPAALRLERLLRLVGGEALMLKGRRLHDHLAGSWIWHDRSLALSHAIGVGQYQVYRVTVKSPDGPVER